MSAVAVVLFTASYGAINLYDEGIVLVGSLRVLHGDVPYRDFWAMYPPGSFYLHAFLFSIFGEHAYVSRVCDAVTKVAIVVAAYGIARAYSSRARSRVVAALILLFLTYVGFPGLPFFQATLLALLIVLLLIRADGISGRNDAARRADVLVLAAGALNGLMVYFRHDLAAYALVAVVISVAYKAFRAGKLTLLAKEAGLFALGVSATFVPLAIYLLRSAGYHDTYFSLIESPAEIYPVYRSLPFPEVDVPTLLHHPNGVQKLLVYFPFVILSIAFLEFVVSRAVTRGRPRPELARGNGARNARIAVLLTTMAALFCLKGAVRPEVVHFAPAIIVSLVLAGYLMWRRPLKRLAPLIVVLVFFFAVPTVKAAEKYLRNAPRVVSSCMHPALPRLACVPSDTKTVLAAKYIDDELPQVKDLYVGAGRHDRIFVGNVAAYFIVPKRPATRWHELHPGIQTRADIQQEMISELSCSKSLVVILDRRWDQEAGRVPQGQPPGSKDLDRFLSEQFAVVKELGGMTILTRTSDGSGRSDPGCRRRDDG
jgi:4-amino-4-deoxy-L-arabinose transferase-like glycosyltransferase